MIEQNILQILQRSVDAAQLAIADTTPIKRVAMTLDPPVTRYLELVHIPNNRSADYYEGARVYQGNFRIILHTPVDKQGPYPHMRLLDSLADSYPCGRRLQDGGVSVELYSDPDFSGPLESGSELLFMLTLAYRCFRYNPS